MKKIFGILFCSTLILTGCSQDYLDTDVNSTINEEQLGKSPQALQGLIDGVYTSLHTFGLTNDGNHEDFGHKAILSGLDLMSNDMLQTKGSWFGSYYDYQGRIQTTNQSNQIWKTYYQQINATNVIIATIDKAGIKPETESIYGQALALRGYMYFMLARAFGPTYVGHTSEACIPIYTAVTYEGKARSTVNDTYKQIVSDLTNSLTYLGDYERTNKEKVDTSVVQAFIAEVALEMGDYAKAAEMAHLARQSYTQPTEAQWLEGFYDLDRVPDVMWGGYISPETSSFVASFFGHFDNTNKKSYAGGLTFYKSIDKRLYDAMPITDYRKKAFQAADNAAPYKLPKYANLKFKDGSVGNGGDYVYLRASEMYYIEAESLARTGNESAAKAVLKEITVLRNPAYTVTATGSALIDEIILQKRIELWGEGCAWTDMKRLNVPLVRNYTDSNHILTQGKIDIPAGDPRFKFQIPQSEMLANPNMVQNP